MAISTEHLLQLKQSIARTTEVNKETMEGIVPNLMKNSEKVLGQSKGKNFFYRQWTWFEDFMRRNVLSRFLEMTTLIYHTSVERGEKYMQFVEAHFDMLRASSAPVPENNVWEVVEEIDALQSKRRTAIGKGDKQTGRELTTKIAAKEKKIPLYLKAGAKVRQTAKGKVRFFNK